MDTPQVRLTRRGILFDALLSFAVCIEPFMNRMHFSVRDQGTLGKHKGRQDRHEKRAEQMQQGVKTSGFHDIFSFHFPR